jgi:hypothetical protein
LAASKPETIQLVLSSCSNELQAAPARESSTAALEALLTRLFARLPSKRRISLDGRSVEYPATQVDRARQNRRPLGLSSAANRQIAQKTRIPEGVVRATLRKPFGTPGV